jgi:hypothetical protein
VFLAYSPRPASNKALSRDEHATVVRLFVSRHVKDLRLILGAASVVMLLLLVIGPILAVRSQEATHCKDPSICHWVSAEIWLPAASSFLLFLTPVIGAFGILLAWAYQTGSARLGVVDLFACEISTLCRITTVLDSVKRLLDRFNTGPRESAASTGGPQVAQFSSQENYFPVFDACVRDLQTLDAEVVINIAAFYTYMKAARDSMRSLAGTSPEAADFKTPPLHDADLGPWHDIARNVLYLLYLGLESARKSIKDLVEFEPELMERTIVILISELQAYGFLRQQFTQKDDARHERIQMRMPEYQQLVPHLCGVVEAGQAAETARIPGQQVPSVPRWLPSWLLLADLRKRFQEAMGLSSVSDATSYRCELAPPGNDSPSPFGTPKPSTATPHAAVNHP